MAKTIEVLNRQSIWDISVQETGTIENAMKILAANGLGFADGLPQQLIIPDELVQNNKIKSFYAQKNIIPGTLRDDEQNGIGIGQIGIDFEIG